jgi:ribosomal protein S18 acetylase RimI-like enzyme
MKNSFEIISLRKKEVFDFINQPNFKDLPQVPISYIRGLAHSNNPTASAQDVILLLVYDNTKIIGYLGIYPITCPDFVPSDQSFGFLSCLWVSEEYRGRKIASQLLLEAHKTYKGNIALTDATEEALFLYKKSKLFGEPKYLEGKKFYVKGVFGRLLGKKTNIPLASVFFNYCIDPLYSFINQFLLFTEANKLSKYSLEDRVIIKSPFYPDEIIDYAFFDNSLFPRDYFSLDWICKYPWIANNEIHYQNNYYFTSYRKDYSLFLCSILDDQKENIICQALFLKIDGELKLKYVIKNNNLKTFREAIIYLLLKLKAKTFTSFDEPLNNYLERNNLPFGILSKKIRRAYLFSQKLSSLQHAKKKLYAGDADALFT